MVKSEFFDIIPLMTKHLEEQLLTVKGIRTLKESDYPMLRQFLGKEDANYASSLAFYLLALKEPQVDTDSIGFIYEANGFITPLTVAASKVNGELNIYIANPLGKNKLDSIITLVKSIRELNIENKIYVTKLSEGLAKQLIINDFHPIEDYPWHPLAIKEDDTLPEVIFDVKKSLEEIKNLPSKKQIRRSYAKANHIRENHKVVFTREDFVNKSQQILDEFFNLEKSDTNLSTSNDYYQMINKAHSIPTADYRILEIDDIPTGFYITDIDCASSDTTNLYSLVTLRKNFKYANHLVLFEVFERLQTKYLNGGGSEDKNVQYFKEKYIPSKYRDIHWVVNVRS